MKMKIQTSKFVGCSKSGVLRGKFIALNAHVRKEKNLKSII